MSHCTCPLVVDLDGTLLRSDLLLETGMAFARARPMRLFWMIAWLMQGKASLKHRLAEETDIDVTVLPYDKAVIELIESERRTGRSIVLVTASHDSLAQRIARHLHLFDEVRGSSAELNLTAHRKRDLLVGLYGQGGFDYVGNSHHDVPVWASARKAYVVNPEIGVVRRAKVQGNVEAVISTNPFAVKDWLKALRLHQWTKNLLVFVPLLAAHQITNPELLWRAVLAFVLFGLCASSVYVLNDLLDLGDDRHHLSKRHRPFAAGRLSIKAGLLVFPALLAAASVGAWLFMPWQFAGALAAYYVLTLAYSFSLKQQMALDVIVLAMLYTLRVIAGAMACGLNLTFWILAFSMFMFLSLALVKRYAELRHARIKGDTDRTAGRGYYPGDLEMISSLGASSGYLAVMVLALYIYDQGTVDLYRNPQYIWLACPLLLFWITRIWMLTHRGRMHDDPVVFALRDKASLLVGVMVGMAFWLAT